MKIVCLLLSVACVTGAGTASASGTEVAFDESAEFLSLDTRTDVAVRTLALGVDLQPVVCNNAADWTRGGDLAKDPASVRVTRMYGADPADPSGWVDIAVDSEAEAAGAEATVLWEPTLRRLYRVEMLVDGAVVQTAYFDLLNATDLEDGRTPVADDRIVIETPDVSYTGNPVRPTLTVFAADGVTPLVEGRDYVMTCSDNVQIGTASVTIEGVGDYSESVTKTFRVVSSVPVEVAADEAGFAGLDSRKDPFLKVAEDEWIPVAWNNSETFAENPFAVWLPGGSDDTALSAVVTVVRLAGRNDEPDWTKGMVVSDGSAEGTSTWCPSEHGWWAFRLTIMRDGVPESGEFVRRIKFGRNGLLILVR